MAASSVTAGLVVIGDEVLSGDVSMMDREVYVNAVVDFLERIPPEVIVERVSGDAPADFLIEPKWCLEKSSIRLSIEQLFRQRGTRQGSRYSAPELLPQDRPRPPDLTPESIRQQIETRGRLA